MELPCRDRLGVFNATFFRLWSCSMCYTYLFQDSNPAFFSRLPHGHQLLSTQSTSPGFVVSPDIDNVIAVGTICLTLEDEDCERWKRCCRAAELCCQEQRMTSLPVPSSAGPTGGEQVHVEASDGAVPGPSPDSEGVYVVHGGDTTLSSSLASRYRPDGKGGFHVYCPHTWDGFGCFQDTLAGHTASISCPTYIDHSDPSGKSSCYMFSFK